MANKKKQRSTAAVNRKAGFDIQVEQTYEAGLILTGDEIKSIRAGRVQLTGSYVKIMAGHRSGRQLPAVVVLGLHLGLAEQPDRIRPLLLHGAEVRELERALRVKGQTAVPLDLYLSHGWAKLKVGVGRGRKAYDKREVLKKRDIERDQRRDLKYVKRP
ncbi:SsrA-binding protein SmpB [Patescibacteria group bacterium]|nr:SsrA-binding protein SmpB [Patescibacteria group bacterium]